MKRANPTHRNREFEFTNVRINNRTFCECKIHCATCFNTELVHTNAALTDDKYRVKFARLGWNVDKPGKYVCRDCGTLAKRPRLVHSTEEPMPAKEPPKPATQSFDPRDGWSDLKRSQTQPSITQHVQEAIASTRQAAEPPKQMDLDAMLLVLDSVEAYYDPKTGYKDGYTDQKVADDLNCPVAWVKQVRTKKFGDLPETPEIIELRKAIVAVNEKILMQQRGVAHIEKSFNEGLATMRRNFEDQVNAVNKVITALLYQQEDMQRILNEAIGRMK